MAKSEKPIVIEHIFDQRYDPVSDTISSDLVTSEDLYNAKAHCKSAFGLKLKVEGNPYNFMKDIVRGVNAAAMWPDRLKKLGWSGEQVTGEGNVFRFVKVSAGSADPLSTDLDVTSQTPVYKIQSLSLPHASKALGRSDEPWLLQVAVNLRVIETHLAVTARPQITPLEVSHLQMDLKLRKVQIDAMYLAICKLPTGPESVLITLEAKKARQRILLEQVKRQVDAAFKSSGVERVLPMAIKSVRGIGIYVAEFELVERANLATFTEPKLHADAVFHLLPPVLGI